MDERIEAERLVKAFDGQPHLLVGFLSGQLSVLKAQSQTLMGLSGLAITVTGFSGHHMVAAGPAPSAFMVLGILSILVATILTLRVGAQLRWVTQDLGDDLVETALAVILRRNDHHRRLSHAGTFVALGLAGYLLAVVLAALKTGGAW